MRYALSVGWLVSLVLSVSADDPVKVATDPAKAGPDFLIQGEYVGRTTDGQALGAEVVARGDGKFLVNLLPGGLRGEGGDYKKHVVGDAITESGKVTVNGKDAKWSAAIAKEQMTGKSPDGKEFTLARVVRGSKTMSLKPPPGAIVLFDGTSADEWQNGHVEGGNLLGSDIPSKRKFGDHTIHLEFRLSYMPFARGQGRSNSGVYPQNRYEVQVLDSFGLTGANNECGGIYSRTAPSVNMCYPPLTWQTYDIDFTAAKFDKDGKKTANAVITVRHNGVLIHDKVEIAGITGGGIPESADPGPLFLQGHGGGVQYRNIWVVEKK